MNRALEVLVGAIVRLAPRAFRERYGAEVLRVHRARTARAPSGLRRGRFVVREVVGAIRLVLRLRLGVDAASASDASAVSIEALHTHLRLAARTFRRHPGYAWTAVGVLTLGIGAAAAVFTVANAYLFRPLPFPDAGRLMTVYETNPERDWTPEAAVTAAPANVLDWRDEVSAFEDVAMHSDFVDRLVYPGGGEPQLLAYVQVSGNFFDVLGVRPVLGRGFRWDETWASGEGDVFTVVLSHGIWQRMFGGDPEVVGRVLDFGVQRAEIVGVMPGSFRYPSDEVDLWIPYGWPTSNLQEVWFRRAHFVRPVARLAPDVTASQAAAELQGVVRRLDAAYPETNRRMGAVLVPFRDFLTRQERSPLLMLIGAAALLLVLASVNVATLAVVRAGDRSREVAVRRALGAGRRTVVSLVLSEVLVLAAVGGAVGLGVAWLGIEGLQSFTRLGIDGATRAALDHRVLSVVLGGVVVCAAVAALTSVPRVLSGDRAENLQEAGRAGTAAPSRLAGARTLVAAEVALAVLLLSGAGLMVRTSWHLHRVDPGFEARGAIAVELTVPVQRYPDRDQVLDFQDRLIEALEARPGVRDAGIVGGLPLAGPGWSSQFQASDWPADRIGWNIVHRRADRGYFEALQIPLIRGRHLAEGADPDGPLEIVVNETFAREHFPGEDPIGQSIAYDQVATGASTWYEIVGIVGDQHQVSPAIPPRAEAFEHRRQDWSRTVWVVVRTEGGDPLAGVATFRSVLEELDPLVIPERVRPMQDVRRASMGRENLVLGLLGSFALTALLLASVGIYGVTARLARRRTQEIGIRMALGAAASTVLSMVLRQGLVGVGLGLGGGLLAAAVATRGMESLLFRVEPSDPLTLAVVAVLLGAVALAACWIPARRAARIDPSESLRSE